MNPIQAIQVPAEDFHNAFTHYALVNGEVICFRIDKCENCGSRIQAPNAVKGRILDIPRYKDFNMKRLEELPPENFWSDDLECEACEACNAKPVTCYHVMFILDGKPNYCEKLHPDFHEVIRLPDMEGCLATVKKELAQKYGKRWKGGIAICGPQTDDMIYCF